MNVLLCDDDIGFINNFSAFLKGYNCCIYKHTSVESAKSSPLAFDIAFLDIELDGDSLVFDLIDSIRAKNPKCVIAFVTNHIKYAPVGYEYNAFRYILKGEPEQLIRRRIDDVINEYKRLNILIRGSYKNEQFAISPHEVYYIEISNHILRFHTSDGIHEMYSSIGAVYPDLAECGFIRCHRSYLVNLGYVRTIYDDSFFILKAPCEAKIPLGIRFKSEAKEKYFNYVGERL